MYNVKVMSLVPVENEVGVKQTSYTVVKTAVSFSEAKNIRKNYGKNAFIVPYVARLEIEQPERKFGSSNKTPYKHHTKPNKKVVL